VVNGATVAYRSRAPAHLPKISRRKFGENGGVHRHAMSIPPAGVIGLGYVGLPLAVAFAQEGCEVIEVDLDARKVEAIATGQSYIEDVPSELLQAVSERIHACTRYSRLAKADAVLVCGLKSTSPGLPGPVSDRTVGSPVQVYSPSTL